MKKLSKLLLSIATVVCFVLGMQQTIEAKQIDVSGLNANDAVVVNSDGQVVDPNTAPGTQFNVKYEWSIPDNVNVSAGDTATVTLPDGLVASSTVTGDIKLSDGTVVGTISIQQGSNQGTITFNNALHNTYGKHGVLTISATKKDSSSGNSRDWMVNKTGWIDQGSMQGGAPTKIYWDVVVNPDSENLKNVVVTDTLGLGQSFDANSVVVHSIKYDQNGNSQQIGVINNVKTTVNGDEITFDLGDISGPVEITYQTTINSLDPNGSNIWENSVKVTGDGISGSRTNYATVSWGAGGTADSYEGKIEITKVDQADHSKFLPGAVFELKDSSGAIIRNGLTTNSNGKINIDNLPDGTYELIEVQAPAGYELDSTPITIEISKKAQHDADVTVTNKATKPGISSSSSSALSSSSSSAVASSSSSVLSSSSSSAVASSSSSVLSSSSSSAVASSSSSVLPSSSSSAVASSSNSVLPSSSSSTVASSSTSSALPSSLSSAVASSSSSVLSSSSSSTVASLSNSVLPSSSNKKLSVSSSKQQSLDNSTNGLSSSVNKSEVNSSVSTAKLNQGGQVNVAVKNGSSKSNSSSSSQSKSVLPQTGSDQKTGLKLIVIGVMLLVITGIVLVKRKEN